MKSCNKSFYLLGWLLVLAWMGLFASGCIKWVRLPNAPPFPDNRVNAGEFAAHRLLIRKKIDRLAVQLWSYLEQSWGVEHLRGKFSVLVEVQSGKMLRCKLQRSKLQADLPRAGIPIQINHAGPFLRICTFLKQQSWPHNNASTVVVEHLLSRTKP